MKELQLIIAFAILSISINGQITAEFTASTTSGCEETEIEFLDQSTSNGTITSWLWDFGDGNTSNQQNPTITYFTPASYTICLTVTNDMGGNDMICKTDFIVINPVPVCIIDLNVPILNCTNSEVALDGSQSSTGPNFTYFWSTTNGNILSGSNTAVATVDTEGFYTLTITNITNGCSSNTTVEVTSDFNQPIADVNATQTTYILDCTTGTISPYYLDGSNSSTGQNLVYEWHDSNNNLISNEIIFGVNDLGTYIFTVTDTISLCTDADTATITLTQNITPPIAEAGPDMVLTCLNTTVILGGTGSSTGANIFYEWYGNGSALNTTLNPTVSAPGIYTLIVTNADNGCTATDEVIVTADTSVPVININATTLVCPGELVMIDMSPPCINCTVEILDALGNPVCTTGLPCEIDPADGPFQITATDLNTGCQNIIENFEISVPNEITITDVTITNVSCTSTNDGAIDITVTGGTTPYEFAWSNGSTLPNQSNLVVGTYSLTITDVSGCIYVSPDYEVIQNACFTFANDTTICPGEIVSLSNDSPTAGWNYAWTPAAGINNPNIPNPIAYPSETTTYFLTITDGNGMVIFSGEGPTVTVQNYLDFGLLDFSNAPLCEGDTLELYGNIGITFFWTGPNSYAETSMNPIINDVTEFDSGIYSLTITDNFGCTASADVDVFIDDDCVWPGDTDTNLVVNHFDLLNIGLAYDSVGTTRENASFDWFGQPSFDWSQTTPTSNVNFKHIDADGNGIIEAADTVAITQNFGLTHNFSEPDILNQFTDLPPTDGFTVVTPFYIEPDTLIEGETIALNLILGDVSNIVTGLYGIGFSIEYDSSVIVPGSASINFDNCWLGDVNADAISIQFDFHSPGRIDAAITRIDGIEMDGYGIFGDLIITLEDDILLWDGGSNNFGGTTTDVFADFAITNYHLINFSQEEILVEGMTTSALIGETTSLSFIELNDLISVFPNPAKDAFFIASQKIDLEVVRIFSTTGELKAMKTNIKNTLEFSTEELASGIYFIEIQTSEGIVTKKLSIVK